MARWIVLAAAVAVALAWRAPAHADAPSAIVFFGDSLTYGLHASAPERAFRAILTARLARTRDAGPVLAFIQDPVGLLDDAQQKLPLVLAARPALVFLELGHHEIWSDEEQLARFEGRYADILDRLLASGAEVIPATLSWLGAQPGSFAFEASLRINAIIRRLAAERGLVVADLWTPTVLRWEVLSTPADVSFVPPYTGDDLHPNDAGHRVLAEAFWKAYREHRQRARLAIPWSLYGRGPR
jgi:lysophospholipase L1-like esterase